MLLYRGTHTEISSFRVTSCPHSVLYEQGTKQNSSRAWGKLLFLAPRWNILEPLKKRLFLVLPHWAWGLVPFCQLVHSASQGPKVQIWLQKTLYRCPKNYPIKREFGTWFHTDHLLLKSCSNGVKSLAIIEQISLNLLSSPGLAKCWGETCGDDKSTGSETLKHMTHVLHLMVLEHSFEDYDLDYNLHNWPMWGCQSCLNSYHL